MFSADVRLEGFTATDWDRMLGLFKPRPQTTEARDPERPRGGVVAVHRRGRLRKLLHTDVGRLRLDDAAKDWPISPEELARRHRASWSLVIEAGSLEHVMDGMGARARRDHDLLDQILLLLELFRDEFDQGTLTLWPRRLQGAPIPSARVVKGMLDSVCPISKTMLFGFFSEGKLWTSVALRRQSDGFDVVLGPDEIRGKMGLLSGDWRRDHRHLARAVEKYVGPLALGFYTEVVTFRGLLVDPAPGAWTRAVAVRDVILSPVPPAMAIPLGIDAGRAAAVALRNLIERVDPLGVAVPTARAIFNTVVSPETLSAMGFQPLEILRRLMTRDQ